MPAPQATMMLNLPEREMRVLEQLAEHHCMSKIGMMRQALRLYQLIHGGIAILPFPGVSAPQPVGFTGIPKVGHIDGVVIRVGGRREEIHIMVQAENGIFSKCVASKAVAKTLANHMFDDELRLHGTGRWSRGETGQWTLQKFIISHFEVLDQTPLSQVISDVREMGKGAWIGDNLWAAAVDVRDKALCLKRRWSPQ